MGRPYWKSWITSGTFSTYGMSVLSLMASPGVMFVFNNSGLVIEGFTAGTLSNFAIIVKNEINEFYVFGRTASGVASQQKVPIGNIKTNSGTAYYTVLR